jgi:hypothetical protein
MDLESHGQKRLPSDDRQRSVQYHVRSKNAGRLCETCHHRESRRAVEVVTMMVYPNRDVAAIGTGDDVPGRAGDAVRPEGVGVSRGVPADGRLVRAGIPLRVRGDHG